MKVKNFHFLFLILLLFFTNCKKDRILDAQIILKKDPKKAIKILHEEESEFAGKFETQYLLSLAYLQLNDFTSAEKILLKSLEKKWTEDKLRLFKEKLLEVYKGIYDSIQNKEPAKAFEYLKKSALLEKELQTRAVWANHRLFEMFSKNFENFRKAGDLKSAMQEAKKINELYYIEEVKKRFVQDYRILHKQNFKREVLAILFQQLGKKLEEKGKYNPSTKMFVLKHRFVIPDAKENPSFNISNNEEFEIVLRKSSCLPLLDEISSLLNTIGENLQPPLQTSKAEVGDLFAIGWNNATAGYEKKNAITAKNKKGFAYICEIKIKEDDVIDKLYKILPKI